MKSKIISREIKQPIRAIFSLFFALTGLIPIIPFSYSCNNKQTNNKNRIVVDAEISNYFYWELKEIFTIKDNIRIQYNPFYYIASAPSTEIVSGKVKDGKVTWIIYSDESIHISPPFGTAIIMNPGDSVHINYIGDKPTYSGKNINSLDLLNALMVSNEKLLKPHKKHSYNASTLEDFMEWNKYIDDKLALQVPIIESFKDKIPEKEYIYYKGNTICAAEKDRQSAFNALKDSIQRGYKNLSNLNLVAIWDSTQCKPWRQWLRSLTSYYGSISNFHDFNRMDVWRKYNFDFTNDSLNSKEIRTYLYYTYAKQNYKGLVRERLLAFILDEQTITEMGTKNKMTQTILKDYYSQPGFPEYKQWVKHLESGAK